MSLHHLLLMLYVLFSTLVILYVWIIISKSLRSFKTGRQIRFQKEEYEKLVNILSQPLLSSEAIAYYQKKCTHKRYLQSLEALLSELLEQENSLTQNAHALGYALGFPESSIKMLHSRINRKIASGCHLAGLYHYDEAIEEMLSALDVASGEVQFQVLMALARIGHVDAMERAFNKISSFVMVNQRAVSEVLQIFSGDKLELYRRLLQNKVSYICALSLNAIDTETAKSLGNDIIFLLSSDDLEVRISAIKALGATGSSDALKPLTEALCNPAWEVRAVSAKALGSLGFSKAIDSLMGALSDAQWWVRFNAAEALLTLPENEAFLKEMTKLSDPFACDSLRHAMEHVNRHDLLNLLPPETLKPVTV